MNIIVSLPAREKGRGEGEEGGRGRKKGKEEKNSSLYFKRRVYKHPFPKRNEQKQTFSFNNRIVRRCGPKEALHGRHPKCIAVVFQQASDNHLHVS